MATADVIFEDGFESGDVSTGGWTYTGALVVDGTSYSGSYAARIDDTGSLQKIVDTTGYDSVTVEFAWYTYGYDSGEYLYASWSTDGNEWNVMGSHQAGWQFNEVALPPEAADQPTLYIEFSSNANGWYERFRIDDVAVIGGGTPPNDPPGFTEDPFSAPDATEGSAYSESIAGSATDPDPGDTLTYSKLSGPAWLDMAPDGTLSGIPGSSDIGANGFSVQVSDDQGATDTATLSIWVNEFIPSNDPPEFTEDPFSASDATEGSEYSESIAGSATDPDPGDTLAYSKLSGPAWLDIAPDGALSGIPGPGDVGDNSFSVQVSDGKGGTDAATLNIAVDASSSNPYERGPDPTKAMLEADLGPFSVGSYRPSSTPGFGAGTIWYPSNTAEGPFAAVAVCPGFFEGESAIDWVGPRLASHGFVVITISTNGSFDYPSSRADQLMAALDTVIDESNGSTPISGLVDPNRTGLSGHSMGGGGTLIAARDNPSVDAAIPLAPWNSGSTNFSGVDAGTLIIACEDDSIAPVNSHAWPFFQSLTAEKAFMEFSNEDHFCANSGNGHEPLLGKYIVSWMKRFLDFDTRYDPFLCGASHDEDLQSNELSEYLETCPY